ncbi:uncharacterized protein LOC127874139 isoform X2 [Dreissena polymorpha]|nr:uncharacterized protein LOC127874139 isoform X2 [Dreissena polymorpha]XP_052274291.1 uncharacterized protein LOC127874139 isoform X2 [Dreissena polymorpha]XP_052274292.1 uncharacterized protein LOC127874139 isoform X2 [Dreissena polymorpha]
METEDGTYEDTDMRDNSGRSDIEMQPAHVLHSHGFAATNNRAVPPKPPRLFKYTNQEFDDANQAEKDDRVIRSEETSQAADDDENIYLYADDEPNIKIDRTIPSEYVQYNPDSDHENTDNPKSIEDDCTYMNDESFSKTDSDVKEYDNIKTNPGPNEKRSHTDVEHNNRQSDASVGKKYIDMNASPEPTKKLLHVNTDLRLNILGYAESGGEDYSPDLETPDYENSGNNNIPNNADSDTGSEEDEYYIEMKMVTIERRTSGGSFCSKN